MSTTVSPLESARTELASFGDRLVGPDDARYDEARTMFNAMIDKRPALIAFCTSADDVAAAIRFARDRDLSLAVRGGGHNGGGLASVDDGVVIDLSPLKEVSVDPATQTVRVGGGCVWGEVDAATGPHNLAVPTGIISSTGVGGLTLGGGHGYLSRRHGLTDRQPALGEDGARGRLAGHRERRREPRPLLGDPRRRRQLRRRHGVHVPCASARDDRRRADVLGDRGRGRAPRRLPRVAPVGAAQRHRLLQLPHDPAGEGGVPRGAPPAEGLRRRLVHRRVGRGGRGRHGADAVGRRAAAARGRPDADRGAQLARSTGSTGQATSGTGAAPSSARSRTRRSP